jgi:hypothetical protein
VAIAFLSSASLGLAFFLVMWPATGALFAILVRRRFGERPDADQQPTPTFRRLWSRASDRFLTWTVTFGCIGGAIAAVRLALPGRSVGELFTLLCAAFFLASAGQERRLRTRT